MSTTTAPHPVDLLTPAVLFTADVLDAEKRLLSSGLYSPTHLFNSAVDCSLSGRSFADAQYGQIFATLLGWAECEGDRQPTAKELNWLLPDIHPDTWGEFVWLEVSDAGIPAYARLVARYTKLREEGQAHLQRAAEILGDTTVATVARRLRQPRPVKAPGGLSIPTRQFSAGPIEVRSAQ